MTDAPEKEEKFSHLGSYSKPNASQIVQREKLCQYLLNIIDQGLTPNEEILHELEFIFRYCDQLEDQLWELREELKGKKK